MASNLLTWYVVLCKTIQLQCSYVYRTARLRNTSAFVIRDASTLHTSRKTSMIYISPMVNSFHVNNQCTWSIAKIVLCELLNVAESFAS